jgi:hypothetical protein
MQAKDYRIAFGDDFNGSLRVGIEPILVRLTEPFQPAFLVTKP